MGANAQLSLPGTFKQVYLIIDALDEYSISNRKDLLDSLRKIRGLDSDSLHLLTTSRREVDIKNSFLASKETSRIFWDIRLQKTHVQDDIKTYVSGRLGREQKFEKWTAEERERVELQLTERAHGM